MPANVGIEKKTDKQYPIRTLSNLVVRGGAWVFSARLIQQLFNLVRLIILARILSPKDFGLFGIALLTISFIETFSQTGFQSALIQKRKNIESYLDSAWTIAAFRGFALYVLLFIFAPGSAIFFNEPKAKIIIQVVAISLLFQGLNNIGIVYFQKELDFRKQFIYQISGSICDLLVSVSVALLLRSVWAIVFGLLTGNLVRFILSYALHPYRPTLSLDFGRAKELFQFGKWILGSSILLFFLNQGDDLFVGKYLGATALAFYQMAYKISNMPTTEITHVISMVTFPAYSKIQDNISTLKTTYLKVLQVTAFLSFPISSLILIFAFDFTKLFLGEKWLPMVWPVQVLVFWGLIRSIGATTGPLFMATGRPELVTKIQVIKLILLAMLIYPLTLKLGIIGTALAVLIHSLVVNPFADYLVIKTIKCRFAEFLTMLLIPLFASLVMLCILYFLKSVVFKEIKILTFLFLSITGVIVYLVTIQIIDRFVNYGFRSLIRKLSSHFFEVKQ